MKRFLLSLSVFLALQERVHANLRFASPLQALTIWDNADPPSPRDLYLKKYKAGLQAEQKVRQELKKKHDEFLKQQDTDSPDWAKKAVRYERARRSREERMAEAAYDAAVKQVEAKIQRETARNPRSKNYQFVGVINKDKDQPISWYARKKPQQADWSLRLVHVNRDAIIKDLFNRGKVDIFSKYKNEGFKALNSEGDDGAVTTKELKVIGQYEVREKSWRTLWNFSPRHFFSDSSGMYWRERRLTPGIYTDGTNVYETSYRYKDGRNGIRRVRSLEQFLQDSSIDGRTREKLLQRIQKDHPDMVIEG